MSLSDKLSPEDRRAYAEAYEPLAKQRDAYVACGDQVNAKKIRRQISDLSRFYQNRADKRWFSVDYSKIEEQIMGQLNIPGTSFWFDEASQFTPEIQWPYRAGKSTFFKHQLEAYRMMNEKFCPPKEPQMLKITNSSDMPEYSTDGRACVNVSHLLSKEQMLEVAKLAFQTYGDECMRAMGINAVEYDQHRAIKQFKRGMSVYPHVLHNFIEQHGYRKIQPYNLEVALRQVAEAQHVFPHHFKPKSELPERFYNHAVGHQAPDVAHFDKEAALAEAERIARRTNAEVRTYQLVSTTTIEDVPTTTKQVVRRP